MPTEMTAPRISSNMTPSQPVAGVEVETGGGEEAEADRDENQVQHLALVKGRASRRRAIGVAGSLEYSFAQGPPDRNDLRQSANKAAWINNTTNAAQNIGPSASIKPPVSV